MAINTPQPQDGPPNGKNPCGSMVRSGGRCGRCGHEPRRGADNRFARHAGTCPDCGAERSMRCKQRIGLGPSGRCKIHGGRTPRGFASPNYKNGSKSKFLPEHLRKNFDRAMADPDLISSRRDVAVLESIERDLWLRFADGGGLRLWTNLLEAREQLGVAIRGQSPEGIVAAYQRLGEVIKKGKDQETVLEQVRDVMEQKGRAQDRETRRMTTLRQFIPSEQVWMVAMGLANAVREEVADPKALQRIHDKFERFLGAGQVVEMPALPGRVGEP